MQHNQPSEKESIPELPDELSAFASRLASFEAKSVSVNRDQLMFEAGQAAAHGERQAAALAFRRTLRIWQSAAVVLAVVTFGFGVAAIRPDQEPRIVVVARERPADRTNSITEHERSESTEDRPASQPEIAVRESAIDDSHVGTVADSQMANSAALKEFRSRRMLIAQLLETSTQPTWFAADPETQSGFTDVNSSAFGLSSQSIPKLEKSRMWINRLIKEPSL